MQSIFAFLVDVYDELLFFTDREFNSESAKIPGVENNSIRLAYEILKDNFGFKIPHVIVKKHIPVCGGLGGGSSDAACFVNFVLDSYGFSPEEKMSRIDLFRPLGADAKVFLFRYFTNCRFVYINGTGLDGEISSIDLPYHDERLLVINNGSRLSTAAVFKNFDGPFCRELPRSSLVFNNSLQHSAIKLEPSFNKILVDIEHTSPKFYGVSGSGSSCFAVYSDYQSAENARDTLSSYSFLRASRF